MNGVQMSLLLDTGAAVTLLREDTWARITAEVDAEVGQCRRDATDDSWQCTCGVGPGGGEIHHRDRSGEPANLQGDSGPGLPAGTTGVNRSSDEDTQSEGRRARFSLERPYLHAAASPWEHRSDGSGCGNDRGTTPKRTGDHGESRYLSGGGVASARSRGQGFAGRRGLRSRGADFDYCAGSSSESLDGTGDSICRHDASYAGECGATPQEPWMP